MPSACHSFADLRIQARKRLPRIAFDYIDGAAGREDGARLNRQALSEQRLMPRVLRDMRQVDLSIDVLGKTALLPFGICPMGMCNLAHPATDFALADFAAKHSIPFGISTMSTTPMERLYERAQGNAWFQLYYSGDGAGTLKLLKRAKAAGFETLILTVDVPEVGRRPRELRHNLKIPMRLSPGQMLDCALHPRWSLRALLAGAPRPANFDGRDYIFDRSESRAGADFEFLKRLREIWPGKLVIKGVLNADDAQESVNAGADALIVSSHGCRQLDAAPAAIKMLGDIRNALGAKAPLFYDSSIQSGEDIVKAYAMGADFVFLGRAWLYACAVYGQAGPEQLSQLLQAELQTVMCQIGQNKLSAASA